MEAGKLRIGAKILLNGEPYNIVKYMLRPSSRGAAKMVTKMKNLLTGATIEKTFPSSERLDEADIERGKAQYLFNSGNSYTFMDTETYDQFEFEGEKIGDQTKFLKDDMDVSILKWNGNVINIELPQNVEYKIIEAEPGVKGDTASSANKKAKIETGAEIMVPLFIESGEMVVVNTETGEYKERVK
ncbi:elongation factor P [Candidatus Gracilibacteria bacterium]|nr:elongation factor P [Candidatus Gracilibacteria bacterium]